MANCISKVGKQNMQEISCIRWRQVGRQRFNLQLVHRNKVYSNTSRQTPGPWTSSAILCYKKTSINRRMWIPSHRWLTYEGKPFDKINRSLLCSWWGTTDRSCGLIADRWVQWRSMQMGKLIKHTLTVSYSVLDMPCVLHEKGFLAGDMTLYALRIYKLTRDLRLIEEDDDVSSFKTW